MLSIGRAVDSRPVIGGVVDDVIWAQAPPFVTFIQQEPNEPRGYNLYRVSVAGKLRG